MTYDPAADGWAIPSTTLVEGDHHGDAFVIVMSDAHGGDRSAAGARRLGEVHEVRSIHWSPYDPVRVVNADP